MVPSAIRTTTEVEPACFRAAVQSFNQEDRTVELLFSTGAAVKRYDWMAGEFYLEKLEVSERAINFVRLNAGAPLLDTHSGWSIRHILGAAVEGSARVSGGKAFVTVKFSSRAEVAPILQDIRDGVIRAVSVGYNVDEVVETKAKGDKLATRTAVRWTPYETSLVPMPADIGAKVRGDNKPLTNTCLILRQFDDADRIRGLRLARLLHA